MFMHNGGIGCFKQIKRRLALSVNEQWFTLVQGSTDSEWAFALFLDSLEKAGHHPDTEPGKGGFGHTVLRKAILKTIERITSFIKEVAGERGTETEDSRSLLNFAVTDGESVVCTRYVSSKTDEAASLFFSSGTSWKESRNGRKATADHSEPGQKDYVMERRDKGSDIILVASEPLTFERGMFILWHCPYIAFFKQSCSHPLDNWVTVPTNSTLTIYKQTVMIHPIIDEFYSHNPAHARSAGFAQAKGQTITGPDKLVLPQTESGTESDSASPQSSTKVVNGTISRLKPQ